MEGKPPVSGQELIQRMREDFERTMLEVAEAVNAAPDGKWISGSEEQVRDALGEFRRRTYERALQMRTEAAEAAFSPSAGRGQRQASAAQGNAADERADGQ